MRGVDRVIGFTQGAFGWVLLCGFVFGVIVFGLLVLFLEWRKWVAKKAIEREERRQCDLLLQLEQMRQQGVIKFK